MQEQVVPLPESAAQAMSPVWDLSTDTLPEGSRFDAWHAAVSDYNDVRVPDEHRGDFFAHATYWMLGNLALSVNAASPLTLVRDRAQAAHGGLTHAMIVVGLVGDCHSIGPDHDRRLTQGQVQFGSIQSSYVFVAEGAPVVRWLDLSIPPRSEECLTELGSGQRLPGAATTARARFLGKVLSGIARQAPQMTAADAIAAEQALLSLIAATRCDSDGAPAKLSAIAERAFARARAAAVIERELHSARLSVDRVSDLTGISRTTLYRLFADEDGIASYVRARRLDMLRDDLVDPGKRHVGLARLAETRGFHCLSTLGRAFRDRFACTPSELRADAARKGHQAQPQGIATVLGLLQSQMR